MNAEHLKDIGDAAATSVALATLFKWLPIAASVLSVIWLGIRIFEWIENRWFKRVKQSEG